MNRMSIIFVTLACAIIGNTAIPFGTSDNDFIRLPLVPMKHSRSRRAASESGNNVNLSNDRNIQYGLEVAVGTPPQKFQLLLDTGSGDLWIPSKECHHSFLCNATNKFDEKASSSYKAAPGKSTFAISYGTGDLTGRRALETVSLGDMTIQDQVIGVATREPVDAKLGALDGIFGWAFKEISAIDETTTLLDNLYDQGQIKKKLSCIKLKQLGAEPGGEFLIGGCDVEAEQWMPIVGNGFWQVNIDKVVVANPNGEKLVFCENDGCQALLDTGASDTGGPPDFADPIIKEFGAKYNEDLEDNTVPCGKTDLPDLEYYFGDLKVVMKPEDYLSKNESKDECGINFSRLDDLPNLLLGVPFLRKLTLILDKENNRVGFAEIN